MALNERRGGLGAGRRRGRGEEEEGEKEGGGKEEGGVRQMAEVMPG